MVEQARPLVGSGSCLWLVVVPLVALFASVGLFGVYRYLDNYWLYRGFPPQPAGVCVPGRVLVAAAGPLASIVAALSLAAGSLPLRRPGTAIALACNLCAAIQGGMALIPRPSLRRETGLVTDGERALQLLRGSGRAQDASPSTGSTLRPANVAALGVAGFHVHHEMFCRPE